MPIGVSDIEALREPMLDLLQRLVAIETPFGDSEAQARVFAEIAKELRAIDFEAFRGSGGDGAGDILYARPAKRQRHRPVQLLLGHSDTDWPAGTLDTMPFVVKEERAQGPGVYEMKGGLVQMIGALRALHERGQTPNVTPVVLITSDEKAARHLSDQAVARLARRSCRAFVLEPALGLHGCLKTQRKGVGRFTIHITSTSSSTGGAVRVLSRIVQRLTDLSDPSRGVSVEVSQIDVEGGTSADSLCASADVIVRARSRTLAQSTETRIRSIRPSVPGTRIRIVGGFERPPLENTGRNRALWWQALEAAEELDLDLGEGMADRPSAGNIASLYTATLDGLGPVGDGAHAPHEFLYVRHLIDRTALLARLLMLPPAADDPRYRAAVRSGS